MGLIAQRAVIIMTIASIPVAVLWTQTGTILHLILGIEPSTAHLAGIMLYFIYKRTHVIVPWVSVGEWAKILAFGLWPSLIFEVIRKHLQGGQVVWPVVVATVISTIFIIVANYLSLKVLGFGFYAVAAITAMSQWIVSIRYFPK